MTDIRDRLETIYTEIAAIRVELQGMIWEFNDTKADLCIARVELTKIRAENEDLRSMLFAMEVQLNEAREAGRK